MEIKKKKTFPEIERALKTTLVKAGTTTVPVLTDVTMKIIINCYQGSVIDIVPTSRFK